MHGIRQWAHGELLACADALRRAKNAVNMSQTLCIKATQSFKEEEKCLDACHSVLLSYVAGAAPASSSASRGRDEEIDVPRRRGSREDEYYRRSRSGGHVRLRKQGGKDHRNRR